MGGREFQSPVDIAVIIIPLQDSARMICGGKVIVIAIVSTCLPSAFQGHANSLRLQHICLHHKTHKTTSEGKS